MRINSMINGEISFVQLNFIRISDKTCKKLLAINLIEFWDLKGNKGDDKFIEKMDQKYHLSIWV